MRCFSLRKFPLEKKKVLVRADFNVPLKNGKVLDHYKIKKSLPTLKFLLKKNCKIILATHLGRPEGKFDPKLKVDPLIKELNKLLRKEIVKLDYCPGQAASKKAKLLFDSSPARIYFLENLRFHPEEEDNDSAFARSLADLADVYVNEAFANCHRAHASVDTITKFLPALPGFLLEKELYYLEKALHPKKPAVWIMGGAKLNKIELLQQAMHQADKILIGGALAFSFLKARGISVGNSKIDAESIKAARRLLKMKEAKKIVLPSDFLVASKFSPQAKAKSTKNIGTKEIGLDIGPETIKLFKQQLKKAQTIVWNGPLGYFEWPQFAQGTKEIGKYLSKLKAITICGGGETAEAVLKFGLEDKITYLSTGGGAALEFLSGRKMPGLAALERNWKKFKKNAKRPE